MLEKRRLCICGGKCEDCGKCNLYDTTSRKKKLTNLPEDFIPDVLNEDVKEGSRFGIAFDIGTTTVVGMLWDLKKNKLVDNIAKTNPQSFAGADVISRISYAMESKENLLVMRGKIIGCMNEMLDEFNENCMVDRYSIVKATVVGNTTMSHLLLGMDVSSLARAPFKPLFLGPVTLKSQEMGLKINPEAEVFILPNIAGHVGSDITGLLIASGMSKKEGIILAIDIGTNGEIVLKGNGRTLTCSTAAGPAFEGACIYQGMRAAEGAIERVRIKDGIVEIRTIGDKEAVGICGSGLIDIIAQMLDSSLISYKGNLISKEDARSKNINDKLVERLRTGENGNEFVLVWKEKAEDIIITQKDIREVQLAKGAIYGGIQILLRAIGAESEMIDEIMLAGAFGSYVKGKSALRVGLLPEVPLDKISCIGNAAGVGACMTLLSAQAKEQAVFQAKETLHVELALHPNFEKEYLQGMYFPKQ